MPTLPPGLLRGPFTLADARAAGLDRWHLEGKSWTRLGPETYIWARLQPDPMLRLRAALLRLPAAAFFVGFTAAWLHRVDVNPCEPIEASAPTASGISARAGIALRRCNVPARDIVTVRGLRATSIERTIADLAERLSVVEAVVITDAALHGRRVHLDQLQTWATANRGRPGIGKLRRVLELAEPASESPMESRLRMALVLSGLPRPRPQVKIFDSSGRFVGRPDLYYDEIRLGIEYDGAGHRDAMTQDNRRQNALLGAGVMLLRFTAADVLGNPAVVAAQVREMLRVAGSRGFDPRGFPAAAGRRGD